MITLDEFIAARANSKRHVNSAWVQHEEFECLYVRVGDCNGYSNAICLANIQAEKPGSGAFKNLVKYLLEKYPEYIIQVECVLSTKFAKGLLRCGFEECQNNLFVLRGQGYVKKH